MKENSDRSAMNAALGLLTVKSRSEAELSERLLSKGFDSGMVSKVLARLVELRLVDDESLAAHVTQSQRSGGRGDHRIRRELLRRGLPGEIVSRALSAPADEESDRAWAALQKRAGRAGKAPRPVAYRRLQGFLVRQGFGVDSVRRALQRYFSGETEEGEMTYEENL